MKALLTFFLGAALCSFSIGLALHQFPIYAAIAVLVLGAACMFGSLLMVVKSWS